jgi:hypothetical protein
MMLWLSEILDFNKLYLTALKGLESLLPQQNLMTAMLFFYCQLHFMLEFALYYI